MARANRYLLREQIYRVTHRCHDHSFLLRFARDRDAYRTMLRNRAARFRILVLGYVGEGIKAGELSRDARWTESVAVGREAFVREVGAQIEDRMHMAFSAGTDGGWTVKEEPSPYIPFSAPKNASKTPKVDV